MGVFRAALLLLSLWPLTAIAASTTRMVGPDDSLLAVASVDRPEAQGLTLEQWAWAIFRRNAPAFPEGPLSPPLPALLQLPDPGSARAISHAEASAALLRNEPPTPEQLQAAGPVVRAVTPRVLPAQPGRQTITVEGYGFEPGATLNFTNITRQRVIERRPPTAASRTRLQRLAAFGTEPAHWQVQVRNPNGRLSAALDFGLAMEPPAAPMAKTQGFAGSREAVEVQSLLQAGSPAEALQLLVALEAQYAGDPAYDHLLGLASLDSGLPGEALVALQRARAADPHNAAARMELARAHLALGEHEEARREFKQLQGESPPPAARLAIERYLQVAEAQGSRFEPYLRARLQLSSGYDSNANAGSEVSSFLGIPLTDASRETSTGFYGLGGEFFYAAPLTPAWRWSSGLAGSHRQNPSAPFVDSAQLRAATNVAFTRGAWTGSLGMSSHWAALDGARNNVGYGVDFASSYALRPQLHLLANLRLGGLRYVAPLTVQDVDQQLLGLGLGWGTTGGMQFEFGPVLGNDEPVGSASPYGRSLLGARLNGAAPIGRLRLAGGLGWLQSDYDGPFFGLARDDRQLYANLELDASALIRPWSLSVQLGYVNNASDIDLFTYDRVELSFALGWGI